MQFDPDKPAELAWLTAVPGEEQKISGIGVECDREIFRVVEELQSVANYLRGYVSDIIGIMSAYDAVHGMAEEIAKERGGDSASAWINIPGSIYSNAEAQQKLDNFLSACSAFIYRAQTRIRKKFGEDSLEFREFEDSRFAEYDTSFSYRVKYNLRNYSQHENSPISLIPVTVNRSGTDAMKVSVRILLNKCDLIQSSRVQPAVRRQLAEAENEQLNLLEMLHNYYISFLNITRQAVERFLDSAEEEGKIILKLYGSQPVKGRSVPIILRATPVEEGMKFDILHPAFQEIAVYRHVYSEFLTRG